MFNLSDKTRTVEIFHYNYDTGEYIEKRHFVIAPMTGLPANTTDITPPKQKEGYVLLFNFGEWRQSEDNRNLRLYNKLTKNIVIFNELGPIPEETTIQVPSSEFDIWNGNQWVKDTQAEKDAHYTQAQNEQKALISQAGEKISLLSFSKESAQATKEELDALNRWQNYRLQLSRIYLSNAPDIIWPEKP